MARHVWSVLCERALFEQGTQNVSLIGVIEELSLEGALPTERVDLPLRASFVSYWTRDTYEATERGHSRLRLISPTNEVLVEGRPLNVDLEGSTRAQTVSLFEMLPLQGEGTYQFAVDYRRQQESEWTERTRIPLEVRCEPAEESAPSTEEAED